MDINFISLFNIIFCLIYARGLYLFFLTLALYGVGTWIKNDSFKSIILAFLGFTGATLFHGAMFVGALVFILIVSIKYLKNFINLLINYKINIKNVAITSIFFIILGLYVTNKISIQYLGKFSTINEKTLLEKTNYAFRGDASWPQWTKAKSGIELIYKSPVRSIYFIFSPFPWDVKKTKHLIGMARFFFVHVFIIFDFKKYKNYMERSCVKNCVIIISILHLCIWIWGWKFWNRHKT